MTAHVTLFISEGTSSENVCIRLVGISGLSIEESERLADKLDGAISHSRNEVEVVPKITGRLLLDFPATSWVITLRYSDGRNDGHLFHSAAGGNPIQALKESLKGPPPIQRISRYARKPVI